jgi:hypothetical protein
VRGILADVNVEGHYQALLAVLQTEPWRDFWGPLNLAPLRFADVGLSPDDSDRVVWEVCQREGLVLVTGNRNAAGPDSLEVMIRTASTPHSLPVFTLASPDRVLNERSYTERAAVRMLDYLTEMDRYRATGRLYIP